MLDECRVTSSGWLLPGSGKEWLAHHRDNPAGRVLAGGLLPKSHQIHIRALVDLPRLENLQEPRVICPLIYPHSENYFLWNLFGFVGFFFFNLCPFSSTEHLSKAPRSIFSINPRSFWEAALCPPGILSFPCPRSAACTASAIGVSELSPCPFTKFQLHSIRPGFWVVLERMKCVLSYSPSPRLLFLSTFIVRRCLPDTNLRPLIILKFSML